jgi:polyhydroxyalkanoate synthesis regulator phasin
MTTMTDIQGMQSKFQEKFKEAWSQALVGINAAEQEAEKVFARLGFSPEDVKRHAREFGERLALQRKEIEKGIDDAVRRAANRFKLPTKEDIEGLKQRLDAISERVDKLSKDQPNSAETH